MTTPAKSALDAARERLELRVFEAEECVKVGLTKHLQQDWCDLRLVLDALKEAERERDKLLKAQAALLEQIEIQSERIEILKDRAQ